MSLRQQSPKRFLDTGIYLFQYLTDEVWVICPSCGTNGKVHYHPAKYSRLDARFRCGKCAFSLDAQDCHFFSMRAWRGPVRAVGKRACGYCGLKWVVAKAQRQTAKAPLPDKINATCQRCGHENETSVYWQVTYDPTSMPEPMFGLALALNEPIMPGRSIWAFNPRQLLDLKGFVGADLREKGEGRGRVLGNSTYFSRLPSWIKTSRNRKRILKAIERIEQRVL